MNKDRKKELDTLLNEKSEEEKETEKKEEEEEKSEEKEEQEKEKEDEKGEEEKENDEDKNKQEEKNSEEESGEEKHEKEKQPEKSEDEKDESEKKDKWHGKSREEVIRMYEEMENKKITELKIPDIKTEKKDDEKKSGSQDEIEVPSDEELAKMTPKQFAQWMVSTVKNLVSETYDTKTQMRDSVRQEIREAQKDHPLLKTSPEYRELVLSLIDTASQKGTVISLNDACAKVDEFVGTVKGDTKVTETEKIRLKKAKAQVERGAGAPTSHGEEKGAEERRLEQIFGTSGSKSPLGGLGV